MSAERVLIIAGSNGVGKTTFAREFLPTEANCGTFINANLIAAGLSPFAPETAAMKAGRLMLAGIEEQVSKGAGFAFETTLSGKHYVRRIKDWKRRGYRVSLYFLRLESPELAIRRVANRVRSGGHHIPESVIRRRFETSLFNFETLYKPLVDDWMLFDNSQSEPTLLEWGENP